MSNTHTLVTGVSGFVGSVLCREAMERGISVRGAVRAAGAAAWCPDQVAVGNIDRRTDWHKALHGIDVVIHLAARAHIMQETADDPLAAFREVNVGGTENLARQAAQAGVRRIVYVSSIGVNGLLTRGDHAFVESDAPAPHNPYARSKWEAERCLLEISRETGLEVVIARPPLVYGPNAPGNFAEMMWALKSGIPLPLASVRNRRSLIYIDNLVDALLLCASHPDAAGQTYVLSDGEDVSTPELLGMLGEAMGCVPRLFSCPPWLLMVVASLIGKRGVADRLLGSLRIDSGKIRRELDWRPPFNLRHGIRITAEGFRGIPT